MISRHWTCLTRADAADSYERHLRNEIFPGMREIPGFRSATVLRKDREEGTAFRIVTEWESLEAVRAFAGDPVERAVVPEEAQRLMIRFDDRVTHYEVRDRLTG